MDANYSTLQDNVVDMLQKSQQVSSSLKMENGKIVL